MPVAVQVQAVSNTVDGGGTTTLTATVTGSSNANVTWDAGDGIIAGTGSTVLYTAPSTEGTHTVKATSQADPSRSASVILTVPVLAIQVTAPATPLDGGATQAFTATVIGNVNKGVTWSIVEGASAGSINAAGLYTAPNAGGSYTIIATSLVNSSRTGTAKVTVNPVAVQVQALSSIVDGGGTTVLTASVTGNVNQAVTWDAGDGLITGTGNSVTYTAPSTEGAHAIKATSLADPSHAASISLTVPTLTVLVATPPAAIDSGTNQTFSAIVTGNVNKAVSWSVVEGANAGFINNSGIYTAPYGGGTFTIQATSLAIPARNGSAKVTVKAPPSTVAIRMNASEVKLAPQTGFSFAATVTGTTNTNVTWNASAGSIDSNGWFVAPSAAGPVNITATSAADGTKTASSVVTVVPAATIAVSASPSPLSLRAGNTAALNAQVTGTSITNVFWSVLEGPTGGSVSSDGVYTAPSSPGTYHVKVQSTLDPSASDTIPVTVTAAPTSVLTTPFDTASAPGGGGLSLNAVASGTGTQAMTWTANGGTLVTSTSSNPVAQVLKPAPGLSSALRVQSVRSSANSGSATQVVYYAPSTPGIYTVTVTSVDDPTQTVSITVTVSAPPADPVFTTPISVNNLIVGNQVGLTANVPVAWSVQEASGGSITSNGVYVAPATPGIYHVLATSVADGSKQAIVRVVVRPYLLVSPTQLSLPTSDIGVFASRVYGNSNRNVVWTVQEANGGAVDGLGIYRPPSTPGSYHLICQSQADPSQSVTISVTVTDSVGPILFKTGWDSTSRRHVHTATKLLDGRILLAGGADTVNDMSLATAEIFDPVSGTFTATGSMSEARAYHRAVLLTSGKVLVVGGTRYVGGVYTPLASSEIYDPATGSFTPAGAMSVARDDLALVALGDGTALAIGGGDAGAGYLASLEAFHPTSGTWTVLPASMSVPRGGHTATVLTSGKVLIAGGGPTQFDPGSLNLELFDPTAGTFSAASGQLSEPRFYATATLTQGSDAADRVLIAGGTANPTADVYLASSNSVAPTSTSMALARSFHAAVQMADNRVMLLGGANNGDVQAGVEVFDPNTSGFVPDAIGRLNLARQDASATLLGDGRVLVAGGYAGSSVRTSEIYAPVNIVSLKVNPEFITLAAGAPASFVATVLGTSDLAVDWSVLGGGQVDTLGNYLAPSTPGTYQVVATSHVNPAVSASAQIRVLPADVVSIVITPNPVSLQSQNTMQFSANVSGATDTGVTWSVAEAAGGTIGTDGVYQAPAAAGTYHVVATSVQDSTRQAIAIVSVTARPTVYLRVNPFALRLRPSERYQFQAQVSGTSNTGVQWSVVDATDVPFPAGGTITQQGLYTAPAVSINGNAWLKAVSLADPSQIVRVRVGVYPWVRPILISPSSNLATPNSWIRILAGQSLQFTSDQPVAWTVDEPVGGVIDASGFYTAPLTLTGNMDQIFTVRATRTADGINVTTFVHVYPLIALDTRPQAFPLGDRVWLKAVATSNSNTSVTYQLLGPSTFGNIDGNGVFSPTSLGTQLITATSLADPSAAATATLVIQAPAGPVVTAPQTPMNGRRNNFTATTLQDGRVLIVGGIDGIQNKYLVNAEIFDPATGSHTPTGSLNEPRAYHRAVLLNDGRVFVEGGSKVIAGIYYTVSTAEVYDPTTGLWSFSSNAMSTGRDDSGLVKLNDGRLVIIGGAGDDGNYNPKASIEIFDPTTNLFTVQTYAMITPRAGHRATLLQNGKILVTGGDWGNGGNTGEIIDPVGGTVLATGNVMNDTRFYHSSNLLGDGTVLIAGGSYATAPADIYDPATNLFTATASTMTNSRVMHQATLLSDGTVLISGGHYYSGLAWGSGILVSRGSLEHYNPATKTFTPVGRMDTARWGHMDVLINGKVYMFGGNNGYDLADISVY